VVAGIALLGALLAFIQLFVTSEQRSPLVALFAALLFFLAFGVGVLIELWRVIRHADEERSLYEQQQRALYEQLGQHDRELEQAVRQAERAAQARTVFLAHLSDALLIPLQRLTEQTRSITPADPMQNAALTQINLNADLLYKELRLQLDIAQIESGQMNLLIEREVDLAELLAPVIENVRRDLKVNPNVKLHVNIETGIRMDTDRAQLTRMIELLLWNAMRYTETGTITLTIAYTDTQNEIYFRVGDSGASLATDDLPRAFDGVPRILGGIQPDLSLTLGLVVVKALTKSMSGRVWAESAPSGGVLYNIALRSRWGVEPNVENSPRIR
jgi:signal transduction histidine kinase